MGFNLTNEFIDQTFSQLVQISGSQLLNGTGSVITDLDFTGSHVESASHAEFADNAQTATTALAATSATSAGSATTATSASHAGFAVTSSFALNFNPSATASYADNASTASYVAGANVDGTVASATSASFATNSNTTISASHAVQADNAITATTAVTASHVTGTVASASYALTATSASHAVRADGSGTAEDLIITVKNVQASTIAAGVPVYSNGVTGENVNVLTASNDSSATMPAIGITQTSINASGNGIVVISGRESNIDTSGLVAGKPVYVGVNGALTATKPTGSALIQNIGTAAKINASTGEIIVQGSGRSNDLPNLTTDYIWKGDANGVPQAVASSSIVVNNATSASHAIQANNATTATSATSATSASHALRSDISDDIAPTANITVNQITASTATFTSASIGNLTTITGSATIIGDQYIILNSDAPTARFAGIKVYDSGSALTGSFEWDSVDDNWIQVATNGTSAGMLTGISGSKASEAYPANNTILKGTGNHTIQDSNITDSGTLINLNSATNITGSLKITGSARNASTIAGNIKQSFPSPGNNQSVGLAEITGTNTIAGNNYTNKNFFVADFNSFGEQFRDYFSIEYYDGFSYNYGSEFNINGLKSRLATIASGSGTTTSRLSQFVTADDTDGTGTIQMFAGDQVDMRLSAGALGIQMTGSVDSVDGITAPSFTGSLSGSATLATTASSIDNLTQNVQITGSLSITGSARNTSTIVGNIKQSFPSPGNNQSVGLAELTGTNAINGKNYTNKNFFVADFNSFGEQFRDYFSIEYYDGFAYNYGTEFNVNGKKSRIAVIASGSGAGRSGEIAVADNHDGTGQLNLSAGDQVDLNITAGNRGVTLTGAVKNNISALAIASTTASLDCQNGDMHTLTLANGVDTHLDATNVQAGQTISLKVTNNATGAGTLSFSPDFKFAGGTAPTVTAATSAKDILTFQSYDGTTLDGTSVLNLS